MSGFRRPVRLKLLAGNPPTTLLRECDKLDLHAVTFHLPKAEVSLLDRTLKTLDEGNRRRRGDLLMEALARLERLAEINKAK